MLAISKIITSSAAIFVCGAFFCSACVACEPKSDKSVESPKLTRITLYMEGLMTDLIKVDIAESTVRALGPGIWEGLTDSGGKWGLLRSRITPAELSSLEEALPEKELRDFKPRLWWFGKREDPLPTDVTIPLLGLKWADKELVLALPPKQIRKPMPPDALAVYESLDRVTKILLNLENDYFSEDTIVGVEYDDPMIKAFQEESKRAAAKALPKNRANW